MNTPDQTEWETCLECLEKYIAHLEKHEPFATSTIATINSALNTLPHEVDEAFDATP